jgi:hypothetical protein
MQVGNLAEPSFHVVVLPEMASVVAWTGPAEEDADTDSAIQGKREGCLVVEVRVRLKLP